MKRAAPLSAAGPRIVLEGVSKSFRGREGDLVHAVEDVTISVPAGAISCIVGPTGCGKTTILRLAAGLDAPDSGRIVGRGPGGGRETSPIGYLTQRHTLFPWLTTGENIALPLRIRGEKPHAIDVRCREILEALGLARSSGLYPYEISGGMQQRAALGRLLASDADCWLLDEPFGSLDERTRHHLQDLLVSLVAERGITVLFVTHTIDEAVYIADWLHVFSAGPGRVIETVRLGEARPRDRLAEGFGRRLESVRMRLEEAIR